MKAGVTGSLLEAIVAVIKKISARGINVERDKPAGLVDDRHRNRIQHSTQSPDSCEDLKPFSKFSSDIAPVGALCRPPRDRMPASSQSPRPE